MPDRGNTNSISSGSTTKAVTAVLTDILTPELYRRNPFRILGLPVTASTRAIATQVQKRYVLVELGSADGSLEGPFPLKPASTLEDLRRAERELHDPVRRIVHELFWFWPLDGADGAKDPAYLALKAGDIPTATRIWADAAANPVTAPIARHNNAVRWHLTALGLEKRSHKLKEDPQAEERHMRYWKGAVALWDEVLWNDVTWAALSARALVLEDERLSPEFIQDLRSSVAEAFVGINASLLAKYVGEGRGDLADIQVSLICRDNLKSLNSTKFADAAVTQLKVGLRSVVRANDPGIEGRETSGADIASTLIGLLSPYHSCFEVLEPHAEDESWRDTVDDVIRQANLYAVAYVDKTKDHARVAAVLRSAIAFISADELFTVLDRNARSAFVNIATLHLAPYFEVLRQILESKDGATIRLTAVDEKVISHLPEVRQKLEQIGQPIDEFVNAIAVVLRSISVDAWNNKRDADTASKALDLAEGFVRDNDLAEKIKNDRTTLKELQATAKTAKKQRLRSLLWPAFAIIVVAGLIIYGNVGSPNSDGSAASTPASEAAQPPAADRDSTGATGSSQVPSPAFTSPSHARTSSTGTYSVPRE